MNKNVATNPVTKLIKATGYSLDGLMAAWRHEWAFRVEVVTFALMFPIGAWLGRTGVERALLLGSLFLVLLAELVNSAIELRAWAPARNEIGGEDDLLFQIMETAGASFAWAPNAWVSETPEPARVTLAYTLRRAFAYGQGPATKAWTGPKRDLRAVAFWMSVGLAQTVIYGAAALGGFLAKTPRRAFAYRKFVEGAGKLLWFPIIKPRFYGAAILKTKPA